MSRPKGKSSGENATFPILEQYLRYMQAVQEKSPLTIKEYKYEDNIDSNKIFINETFFGKLKVNISFSLICCILILFLQF